MIQTKVSSPCHLKRNFNAFDISIEFFVQFQLFSNNGDQSSKKENKPETFQSFSSVVFWPLLRRKEIGQFYKRKNLSFKCPGQLRNTTAGFERCRLQER